jgi:hypothetical protein
MLANRYKLSVLVLGILLSALSLSSARAAEDTKITRDPQQSGYAPCADSKKDVNDSADKTGNSPDTWYERQSRIPGG